METKEWIPWIIMAIIALSGWAVFLYNFVEANPRIDGSILFVMTGTLNSPQNITTFLIYPYLTNTRKGEVHIKDYQLEADFGNGFVKLLRVYSLDNAGNISFLDREGHEIIIPNFKDQLIYKKDSLAKFGIPIHGFILFGGNSSLYNLEVVRYKLIVIDALGKEHKIIVKPENINGAYLASELTGMKLPSQ